MQKKEFLVILSKTVSLVFNFIFHVMVSKTTQSSVDRPVLILASMAEAMLMLIKDNVDLGAALRNGGTCWGGKIALYINEPFSV